MKTVTLKRCVAVNTILLALLAAAGFAALNIGPGGAGVFSAMRGGAEWDMIFITRLPRVILAALVGVALASSGSAFQSILRNPLADPYILGVSGGAALGSVLGVGFRLPFPLICAVAFFGAFASMLLIYGVAETKGRLPAHTLLLTGVIYNAFAFALIMLVNSLVTMEQAHEIFFLLMGNLEVYNYGIISGVAVAVISGFALLIFFSGRMNIISAGDEDAFHLGVDTERFRRAIFFAASIMIGATVAASGLIGFVGIFIPHIIRRIFGPDHRLLVPASGLFGGAFLIAADTLARTLIAGGEYQTELPVGVITALIGGPFFVFVMKRCWG